MSCFQGGLKAREDHPITNPLPSQDKHHSRHTIIRIRDHRMPSRSFSLEDRHLDRHIPGTGFAFFKVVSFMYTITASHILEVTKFNIIEDALPGNASTGLRITRQ
jgi:hypothetical protein